MKAKSVRSIQFAALLLFYITMPMVCGSCFQKPKAPSPALRPEVVNIPSQGQIESIKGRVLIKKNDMDMYRDAVIGTAVEAGDILNLKKSSIIIIRFKDNTSITVISVDKEKWYVFKEKGT